MSCDRRTRGAPAPTTLPLDAVVTVKFGAGEKLSMDLRQGREVHLVGFGLNGYLGGKITVQVSPARSTSRVARSKCRRVQGLGRTWRSNRAACCLPARRSKSGTGHRARRATSQTRRDRWTFGARRGGSAGTECLFVAGDRNNPTHCRISSPANRCRNCRAAKATLSAAPRAPSARPAATCWPRASARRWVSTTSASPTTRPSAAPR